MGNIFPLETKYTDALDVYYTDEHGMQQSIIMGCYGIGVSRLMGVLAEHFADDKGLVWPENIAPAKVYLARLGEADAVVKAADKLYDHLTDAGIAVLYDDETNGRARNSPMLTSWGYLTASSLATRLQLLSVMRSSSGLAIRPNR